MSDSEYKGLTSQEVIRNREKYGQNVITPVKKESVWELFLDKFKDPIIKLLLVAATLSLVIAFIDGHFAETIGIICAILLATGVSFWFEYDAKRRFEILNSVNDEDLVKVIRDGNITEIQKKDVVVGDTVLVASGDEIPADGKLLKAVAIKVNESTLTGEPITSKTTDPEHFKKNATYPSDKLMKGTTVMEGHGAMEVEAVGDSTEFGKVAEQSTIESNEQTPLNKQLVRLSHIISKYAIALSILIFVILLAKGIFLGDILEGDWMSISSEILNYFMVSVAVMVMAIPEGLPMSITLSLAMSMRRMLKTNNLVRKMHACETMGAVTVICTDKTGTLTKNEMRIADMKLFTEGKETEIEEAIAVNSTAFLDKNGKIIGNPTEGALLLWLQDKEVDYSTIRKEANIIDQMIFTTERKYMATLIKDKNSDQNILYIKGAPEIIRAMCEISDQNKEIDNLLAGYQDEAMRTLAFAVKQTKAQTCKEVIEKEKLTLMAIAAISDPVREDVPDAVKECLDAGIKIKIVTGDTPKTAKQIARQIGLWDDETDGEINHITGIEFEAMTDQELYERIDQIKIVSRARPMDKQRLVKILQQKGEVVAVTGDGTNDAPALNFAHVGLSMGSGTSVAKEASDITLIDDSFKSIATAVMWGRSLYKNIQRFVMFQLTVNFSALVVVFFGSILGEEIPLTVTQILWVNLIMDTFAAIALASLPPNPSVMKDKPRKEKDFIINKSMVRWIIGVGIVMIAALLGMLLKFGTEINQYQLSVFFTVFVMMQVWNLFNARSFGLKEPTCTRLVKCRGFLGILLIILAGQIVIVSIGGEVFRTEPLEIEHWIMIIAATSIIAIGGYITRRLYYRNKGWI